MAYTNWEYNRFIRASIVAIVTLLMGVRCCYADNRQYLCEVGVQGGLGYYVGDATPHAFQNIREAYGAQFRYKFNKRWALAVKGTTQRITGSMDDIRTEKVDLEGTWANQLINMDVMAEYNFLRYGGESYDWRVRNYTPYITLGVGACLSGVNFRTAGAYIPVGLGFKWKFCQRAGLNILWQHNIHLADNLEGEPSLNDTHDMNGTNIMNVDVTSQIMIGIVFEFAKEKKICVTCDY